MIIHDGKTVPLFEELWDPSDKDFIWVAWDNLIGSASISNSEWTVPAGFTIHSQQMSGSVTDIDGNTYAKANGALISTTALTGTFIISNKVTLNDERVLERSVKIKVKQL